MPSWGVSKNQKERMRPHLLSWCQFYPVCYRLALREYRDHWEEKPVLPFNVLSPTDGAQPTSLFDVPLNLWILYLSFSDTEHLWHCSLTKNQRYAQLFTHLYLRNLIPPTGTCISISSNTTLFFPSILCICLKKWLFLSICQGEGHP